MEYLPYIRTTIQKLTHIICHFQCLDKYKITFKLSLCKIFFLLSHLNGVNDLTYQLYKGSYMSAHVLLILLNELGKRDKMRGLSSILSLFFATSLINLIIREREC